MYILIFIFIFLLGTVIGSFLNVVIYRFNTGMTVVNGRSICMTCNRTLRWYELIPVLSFLIQSGKCRRCESTISHQYPLVELTTGIVFALIAYKFLPILYFSSRIYFFFLVAYMFIFSLLIVISVYDLRHKIIPDKLVIIFIVAAFFSMFINQSPFGSIFAMPSYSAIAAGPILALPFASLWLLSKGRLMGLGDGKLVLGIGWMLGLSAGIAMTILSFWIGTVISLTAMFLSRNKMNMKSEIPFAPFLIISALIVFVFNLDIFSLIRLFSI